MLETHPFKNFVPRNVKYLLLGSFTSKTVTTDSNYDWYYCSSRNQFWPIIEEVYDIRLATTAAKKKFLRNLGIGVADIIRQCERSAGNSLDANLTGIVYNPRLRTILTRKPISKIFFTSRFVEKLYRKVFGDLVEELTSIELMTLPSPSPRYATMTRSEKVERYKQLLPYL
ncbi:MAG: uracil-DNA glycosylase family protein [Patescibacteria group bacterium]|nr:uracil-DNA glycosylase family protein [Patescibacteria group bacterium]